MLNLSEETVQALITSLLPILITLVFAWLSSRNDRSKRRQVIEDAKQRIELISAYVNSQNLVIEDPSELTAIKKEAANELYDIKAFLEHKLQSMEKSSEKSENYFRRFFLIYRMRTRLASFFRFSFFIALGLSILWAIALFSPSDIEDFGLFFSIAMVVILSVPPVSVALFLRWLATRFDKSASAAMHPMEAVQAPQ